jgi:cholesterol transport system auxiliary component
MMRLLLVTLALATSSCAGSLLQSKAPPISVYLLTIAPTPGGAKTSLDVKIRTPRVRAGLDSDRIAALYADHRLDYLSGARWSAPLDEVAQDLALQAFAGRVDVPGVQAASSTFGGAYWLEIDVEDFQAEYAAAADSAAPPTIHVRLTARLGGSTDRRVIGQFVAEQRLAATDNRITAVVAAYNQAASAAFTAIATQTIEALQRGSEGR